MASLVDRGRCPQDYALDFKEIEYTHKQVSGKNAIGRMNSCRYLNDGQTLSVGIRRMGERRAYPVKDM